MKHLKRFLLVSLVSLGACQGGSTSTTDIRNLSNGPDLPEECDLCWVDFQACANSGIDIELCEEAVVACALVCEAPLPPPDCDHCFAGYEACLEVAEQGMADVIDCVTGLESCLYSCEGGTEPPICEIGDPTTNGCWGSCEEYCSDRCFNDTPTVPGDQTPADAACTAEMYMECLEECGGTQPPEPPCYPDEATGYCYDEDFCAFECPPCSNGQCDEELANLCQERCQNIDPVPCQPGQYIPGCVDY